MAVLRSRAEVPKPSLIVVVVVVDDSQAADDYDNDNDNDNNDQHLDHAQRAWISTLRLKILSILLTPSINTHPDGTPAIDKHTDPAHDANMPATPLPGTEWQHFNLKI
ncbi:hypothetical protein [Thiobaca trueperi]|uniref:hypothetical protein n=1 Tax=Thiobaca trueperi TaxID=127458 RepID=UPI00104B4B53|nr:hypothetical protein [Thiobaca trueperi]